MAALLALYKRCFIGWSAKHFHSHYQRLHARLCPISLRHTRPFFCEKHELVVGLDNTVRFEAMVLQIPEQELRYSYSRTHVQVPRYVDGALSVWHGPRCLARFDAKGKSDTAQQAWSGQAQRMAA